MNEMEEEIGRIKLSESTEIVVRKTEFKGEKRIDIRKFVKTEKYTGWSKQGISIPVGNWRDVLEILEKVK